MADRFITVAIHTYEKAVALRSLLESEGIQVEFRNVNLEQPIVSSGVRVRIQESDLPLALRIIENREIFSPAVASARQANPKFPVLVPVDFSDNSFEATKAAFCIADAHKTTIVLLHTYIDPYVAGNMQLTDSFNYELNENTREQIEQTAETQMRHFSSRIKELIKSGELPAVVFKTCVLEGVPEDAITEYTRANTPFIIVMGTRGPKKKELDMIGSVTAEVLDKCRFTVLAIPDLENDVRELRKPENILFFSNADQQDILAIDTLYRIFPTEGVKVTIAMLPVKKRPFMKNTEDVAKALLGYCQRNFPNYKFETRFIGSETTVNDIRELEKKENFDLIAVPNKKKNLISRLFNPSLAHRILFASETPMLVIPV